MSFPYKTALITGASSGIGAAFAEALAQRGCDLVLVSRSADKLQALAAQLAQAHGRRAEVIVADLAQPAPAAALKRAVDALGLGVDLLINNAGFGTHGPFARADIERERREIGLNVGAVVDIAHAFLPGMLDARHGAVVNIASMAAFQPMPYMAVYGATKAFVWSFSDALWAECRGRGVHVMAVCPGPVDTPFFEATGDHSLRKTVPRGGIIGAGTVVEAGLRGLLARERLVVPGTVGRLTSIFTRMAPRAVLTQVIGRHMSRGY